MSDDKQMTRAEWERERAAEVANKPALDLASKVAALEYDLKIKRDELTQLQAKLPKEGERVITKAEAERLDAYAALGKPDDLKAALTERDTLNADKVKRDRQDSLSAAAEAAGYKSGVLSKLAGIDAYSFEVRETTEGDQTVRTAYVKDAEGKERLLSELVQAEYGDFLPALTREAAPAPEQDARPLWTPQPTTLTTAPLSDAEMDQQRLASGAYQVL